jgi:hypothetical protein
MAMTARLRTQTRPSLFAISKILEFNFAQISLCAIFQSSQTIKILSCAAARRNARRLYSANILAT